MIAALIDNGSLEPGAHRNLRGVAAALSQRCGVRVDAVSWKHSDRIAADRLDGAPAKTVAGWLPEQYAAGEREFIIVPFFISAQGAIGSALRDDIESLSSRGPAGTRFTFTSGLAGRRALVPIVVARVRETLASRHLQRPTVIVVDHGGPSYVSAQLRDEVAAAAGRELGQDVARVLPASLEGAEYGYALPLFAETLADPTVRGDVIVAPLFLAPGRHAGPGGDLAQIAAAAETLRRADALRCHFTELVGSHASAVDALAQALNQTLSTFHAAV